MQRFRSNSTSCWNGWTSCRSARPQIGLPHHSRVLKGAVPRHTEPRLNPPAPYSDEPNSCRSFLSQCSLIFALQPSCFPTELSRVAYVITLLVGQAREWGTAMWDGEQACCESFEAFTEELHKVFDRSARGI